MPLHNYSWKFTRAAGRGASIGDTAGSSRNPHRGETWPGSRRHAYFSNPDRHRPCTLPHDQFPGRPACADDAQPAIAFGRFTVLPARRELTADGRRVEMGERAFDVLLALIEASGTVVSKDELLSRVWPRKVVEENNLQVQIATLRRL